MGNVQSVVEDVGKTIVNTAEDVGNKVVDTAQDIGNKVVDTAKDVGNAVVGVAETTGDAVVDTAKDVEKELDGISTKITEGAGAVGRSIGDLFYPDNPNRRRRVEQLRTDIQTMQAQYDIAKQQVLDQVNALQSKLDELMRQNGYSTFEELDKKIQKMADGTAVQQWNEFKTTLNKDIAVENLIMTSTGLLTILTGVFAYGMALCGVITAASAGLALEVVGIVALVLAAALAIVAIIDAAEEADRLQEAIHELCFNRVDAKQALQLMNINIGYVHQFELFLTNDFFINNPTEFDSYTSGQYREQLEAITREKIAAELKEYDRTREDGAWTNDDPDYSINPGGKTDKVRAMIDRAKSMSETPELNAEALESFSTLPAEVKAEATSTITTVEPISVPEKLVNVDTGGVDTSLENVKIDDKGLIDVGTRDTANDVVNKGTNGSAVGGGSGADGAVTGGRNEGRPGRGRGHTDRDEGPGGRGGSGGRGGWMGRGRGGEGRGGFGDRGNDGPRGNDRRGSLGSARGGNGRGRGDGGGSGWPGDRGGRGGRGGRWRSPARNLERLAGHRRFNDNGKRIFERRIDEAEQPVIQFVHNKSKENDRVLKQQFKVLKFDNILACTVTDVVTNHQWRIKANVDGAPKTDVDIRDVRFTLTDETDRKVYEDCRILLRGRAAMPA